MKKSISKNLILNLIKTFLSLCFPLITFPYASRVLLPAGVGRVNFSQSIVSYFSIIAALGLSTYAIRECSKIKDDRNAFNKTASELFFINLLSTLFAYILFFIFIFTVPSLLPYRFLLIVCSLSIFFSTLGLEWVYIAQEDFFYITLRSFIFQLIGLVCLFIFVKDSTDVVPYAFIGVISGVGSNICSFIHVRKYIRLVKIKISDCFVHLKPIMFFFLGTIANGIYTMLDTSMVGFVCGDYEVGLYTAATKINRIVLSVITTSSAVLLPRLSYYQKNENLESMDNLLYKSIAVMLCIACPCFVGLEILSKPIILLLSGTEYIQATDIMRIINPIIVVITIGNFLGVQVMFPNSMEKQNLIIIILASIINFTLNIILIHAIGAKGAALSSVIAEIFVLISFCIICRKKIAIKKVLSKLLKYSFYSILMGLTVYGVTFRIESNLFKLLIGIPVGIMVYIMALVIFKDELFIFLKGKFLKDK